MASPVTPLRNRVRQKDLKDKIKNNKFKDAMTKSKTLKWKWTGLMTKEEKKKWTKIIMVWYPRHGIRSRGRQT